jgi:hypothetical protein
MIDWLPSRSGFDQARRPLAIGQIDLAERAVFGGRVFEHGHENWLVTQRGRKLAAASPLGAGRWHPVRSVAYAQGRISRRSSRVPVRVMARSLCRYWLRVQAGIVPAP